MYEPNVAKVLDQVSQKHTVLDIGGWARPFNRANYVVDIMPYETRGFYGYQGPCDEWFSKKTWVIHDISSKKPLPFKNKFFDYVICSHTLEDIRDPLFLAAEIARVGKKGYLEVPSRLIESTKGVMGPGYVGYLHHRWLIEIENSSVIFQFKPHNIHGSWQYHFPPSFAKQLTEAQKVSYLFWDKSFTASEKVVLSQEAIEADLAGFVLKHHGYPAPRYFLHLLTHPKDWLVKSPLARQLASYIPLPANLKHKWQESDFWQAVSPFRSEA